MRSPIISFITLASSFQLIAAAAAATDDNDPAHITIHHQEADAEEEQNINQLYANALNELEHESPPHTSSEDIKSDNIYKRHHTHYNDRGQDRELPKLKKKVDIRKAERERRAALEIEKLNDQLHNVDDTIILNNNNNVANNNDNNGGDKNNEQLNNLKFHKRQIQKQNQINTMHKNTIDILDDHHSGRKLLNEDELEQHTRKKNMLDRKKRSLEGESSQRVSCFYFVEMFRLFVHG